MKQGWKLAQLSDTCTFQRGLTYSKTDEVPISNNIVLRANNIDGVGHKLDLRDLRYISDSVTVPESKKVRQGSLIICTASGSKSHLGKVALIDADYGYAFGGFMGQLTPVNGISPRYLLHAMSSVAYRDFIATLTDGVNINNLRFDDLGRFPIPLPPLPEQQRIVATLDEAFEAINIARTNTQSKLTALDNLNESLLHLAFSGEL